MKINEMFYSISGEGNSAGEPTLFIRMQGCNLFEHGGCSWCDTKYAQDESEGSKDLNLSQILQFIIQYPQCDNIIITGGEPLVQKEDLIELVTWLREHGYDIEVETNGSIEIPKEILYECNWTVDIKCPSSAMEEHNNFNILERLDDCDQVKFVIADRIDFEYALNILNSYETNASVVFSPAWDIMDFGTLVNWIKYEYPDGIISIQLHKVIWGPDKKGV
jgi:7-carboxy-7-deazaguanine synthase